ncbi:MAG: hypothetical protein ACI9S9_004124 [Planctomycetota bacterium]|jgi:hypothetical protein
MTRYDPFAYGEVRLDPNKQKQDGGAPSDADDLLFAEGESVKQAPPADSSWSLLDEDADGLLPGASPTADEAVEFGAEILGEGTPNEMPFEDPLSGEALLSLSNLDDASPSIRPLSDLMGDVPPAGTMDHLVEQPMACDEDKFDMAPPIEQPRAPEVMPPVREAMPANAAPIPSVETESTEQTSQPRKRREVRRRRVVSADPQLAPEGSLAAAEQAKVKSAALIRKRRLPALAAILPLAVCAGGGTAASWFWVMQANPVMASIIGATTLVSALFSWLFLRG